MTTHHQSLTPRTSLLLPSGLQIQELPLREALRRISRGLTLPSLIPQMPRLQEVPDWKTWTTRRASTPDQLVPHGCPTPERFHSPPSSPSPPAAPRRQPTRRYSNSPRPRRYFNSLQSHHNANSRRDRRFTNSPSRRVHPIGSHRHNDSQYIRGDRRSRNLTREEVHTTRDRAHPDFATQTSRGNIAATPIGPQRRSLSTPYSDPNQLVQTNTGSSYCVVPLRHRTTPCGQCQSYRTTPRSEPCYHMQACIRCGRTIHPCRCISCVGKHRQPRECPSCPGHIFHKVYVHSDRSVPTLN